ncbi:cytochrome c [Rhodanobacter sp. 7MK24]|uniref:cytochrome c n=1 Tax=Rhodanobacter sp. 7MK24 TaxID=2775922 RepID=UPI00177F4405|nr:cytochrome c [Rhodanobacter sp. 7MK24]MBD8879314.1 cytochrome c [Rhodanobacter sp. 7MK24]
MRAALLILLGLAIGVIGTSQVMNALAARNPMPKAVMHTLGYHAGELKQAMKSQQCDAAKIQLHLLRLQSTATDIVPTFGIADQGFTDAANKLQTTLQQAVAAAPATCASLATALKPVGEACQSCHQKYR